MLLRQAADQAILNQIVGSDRIAGQRPGIPPQAWNLSFYASAEIGHRYFPRKLWFGVSPVTNRGTLPTARHWLMTTTRLFVRNCKGMCHRLPRLPISPRGPDTQKGPGQARPFNGG